MRFFTFIFLLLLVTISGCIVNPTGNIIKTTNEPIHENNIETKVYFCPRDNCQDIIKNTINNAKTSAHCAFFDLDLKDLINTIAKKSKRANVKVVIDKNNYEKQIKGPGIKVANSKQYMHNKFCIIDNNLVLTGSTNPTNNGVNFNNNNLIIIKSKYIVENYNDEFDELWNGIYASGNKVKYNKINSGNIILENYFCPEDNCKQQVIDTIKEAKESIYFMTFSFTDEDIADQILFKNIDIKGIFEARGATASYGQYNRLKDFGLEVKKDKNKKTMHHKVFIIDNKTVITGSMNPTGSGNFRNDENVLIIHNKEIASKFLEEFEILWG
tara:strand:+ start:3780 stop:4760 length:981 start_codon:yes stop_codon:yes gene_type:complete